MLFEWKFAAIHSNIFYGHSLSLPSVSSFQNTSDFKLIFIKINLIMSLSKELCLRSDSQNSHSFSDCFPS